MNFLFSRSDFSFRRIQKNFPLNRCRSRGKFLYAGIIQIHGEKT